MHRSTRLLAMFLLLLGLLSRLEPRFTDDDAFITFRYAHRIAAGEGFTYNAGERVLGTSTPLFTLALAAAERAGVPAPQAAFPLDLLGYLASAALLYALLESQGRPWAGVFAMVLQLFAFSKVYGTEIGGMETPVYVALVLGAFLLQARGRTVLAAVVAGLAALTHPEGALLLVALAAPLAVERGRVPWRELAAFTLTVLPWVVFAWIYFGSPIPNSVAAKRAFFGAYGAAGPGEIFGAFHMGRTRAILGVLGLLGIAAGGWLRGLRPVAWWVLLYLVFFLASGVPVHAWYLPPYFVPLYALAGAGLDLGVTAAGALFGAPGQRPREVALTLVTLAVLGAMCAFGPRNLEAQRAEAAGGQKLLDRVHRSIGTWLADSTAAGASVYIGDIGYIGWFSGRRILDPVGLVSPDAAAWNRRGDVAGWLRARRPDVCVIGLYGRHYREVLDDPWFRGNYALRRGFHDDSPATRLSMRSPARRLQYIPDYAVFMRAGGTSR
ncbi:MAG: hypothetical protein HZB25_02600 [Candidatus Eisenbacteria bacterium]|nr:hypothetical protein [Candidatus Eisenbacteria bacterium]